LSASIFLNIFSTVLGLCIGSFLNVVIYRLPIKRSMFEPRSHCKSCDKVIFWFENIPVISYLFLRGECSKCGVKLSVQYPLVELVVGVFALVVTPEYLDVSSVHEYFFNLSVFSTFLAITLIDLRYKLIPNVLNIYLAIIFIISSALLRPFSFWFYGGLFGLLVPLSITYLFYLIKGKIGLGGGDIKLFGALGIYLGPMGIFLNLSLSCFLGAIVMLLLIAFGVTKRDEMVPFGPFIVVVAAFQIFFPDQFALVSSFLII
jgi:leader peptidase (prepilin peptidase)/N-methyltransferase